ncbi:MAG: HAD family phosphatase [Eubacteriales bacterium]|nr:HAD family phosphatase [Eubacteriales bacterium]
MTNLKKEPDRYNMKNFKRVGAIIAVVLLLAVFCLPMIFAMGEGENSQAMFRGALGAAFLVPVLIYIFWMVYRMFGKKQKPERSIENIIFDVGQVLVKYDWETFLKGFGFEEEKYEKIADAVFRSPIWDERDKGLLEEEDYVRRFVESAPEYEADIREVLRRSPETISAADYAETWVKYLKNKGYHLYILSNYSNYMLERNRPQMSFLKYADGAVFSCQVGQIKPEPDIYRTLLDRFSLKADKCVFVDDRLENCKGAEKLGIHAVQFHDFKQAAAELEKLGVK